MKGSGAGRQLQCESGRESLAGDQEKLALFERELYKDLCWGLVGFRKLELLPQLNGLFPSYQSINGNQKKRKDESFWAQVEVSGSLGTAFTWSTLLV